MNGRGDNRRDDAPVNFELLATVRDRLVTDDRFRRVTLRPETALDRLRCVFRDDFYLSAVERARVELVWYENGDSSIHYHETHRDESFAIGGIATRRITTVVTTSTPGRTRRRPAATSRTRHTGGTA